MTLLQFNLAANGYIFIVDTSRVVFDAFRIPNPRGYYCYRHLHINTNPGPAKSIPVLSRARCWSCYVQFCALGTRYKNLDMNSFYWPLNHLSLGRSFICTHFTDLSLSPILIFGVISITFMTLRYFYPVLFDLAFSALKKTREVC